MNLVLNSLALGPLVFEFDRNVPESITGPGIFEADNFSLDVTPTPIPAALPLFATGLGVMGLFGWRRKRKIAA